MNGLFAGIAIGIGGVFLLRHADGQVRARKALQDRLDLARWEDEGGTPLDTSHPAAQGSGHPQPHAPAGGGRAPTEAPFGVGANLPAVIGQNGSGPEARA